MTTQKDRIESAIRHIQTSADIDPWAEELAVDALKAQGTCEDAVSRQTLQKELALYPIDDVTTEDEAGYNRAINDVQKMVLHLPSAQPERNTEKWIPCSERLPELDEDGYSDKVLVCFANFTGCEICEYRECDDCHGWYVGDTDDNPEDIGIHVIAWMPLPEPYKEGEQNED